MDFVSARTEVEIPAFNEWRIETAKTTTLNIKLESGTAEIFGTELSPNINYVFKESMKFAISTYHGCKISYTTTSPLDSEYISEETTLKQILNLHLAVEKLSSTNQSSRILLVGPKDSGKTTLARTLASYSLKTSDKKPVLVNINSQLPHFAIPSQLTACELYDSLDIETCILGETSSTGPGTGLYRSQIPLVKNYGLENFNENLELYKCLISELSMEVNKKFSASDSNAGTLIIDTPAFNVSNSKLIQHVVDSFMINIILVVGNERLLVDLRKKLTLSDDTTMIKMPRSSGCVEKEPKFQRELQQQAIKQYFYGTTRSQLNPFTFHCSVDDFLFIKPKELDDSNMELLDFMNGDAEDEDDDYDPFSQSATKDPTTVKRNWKYNNMFSILNEPQESDFMNVIVAIIDDKGFDVKKALSLNDEKEKMSLINKHVTTSTALGFSYVAGYNATSRKLKLLIPTPVTTMPGKILVITQMRYHE